MNLQDLSFSVHKLGCVHVGNPTDKIEYFPSGTQRLKIDIYRRVANC